MQSICERCGATFEHSTGNHRRFCSDECRKAGPIEPVGDLFCEQCGNEITKDKRKGKRFCSRECFRFAVSQNHLNKPPKIDKRKLLRNRVTLTCACCQKQYEVRKSREESSKFCSDQCRQNYLRAPHDSVVCEYCQCTFSARPNNKNRFCSKNCYNQHRRVHSPRKNWPSVTSDSCTCRECGKVFNPGLGARGQYCSIKCAGVGRGKSLKGRKRPDMAKPRLHLRNRVEKTCINCGALYESPLHRKDRSKYCSKQCRLAYDKENKKKTHYKTICDQCGKVLSRTLRSRGRSKNIFCDKTCKGLWMSQNKTGENHASWKGGTSPTYYGPDWYSQRRKAIARDGHRCQICRKSSAKKLLHVHHIIPFKTFNYVAHENENHKAANRLSNLVTLCASCHQKVEKGIIPFQPFLL